MSMYNKDFIQFPVYGQNDYFRAQNQQDSTYTPYYNVQNTKNQPHTIAGKQKTVDPIVTGTSVLAIKYNGGVVMGTDMVCAYGSLMRFNNVERQKKVGTHTLVGAGGEYSDFQSLSDMLDDLITEDICIDDGSKLSSKEIWNYLARVLYNSRNKGNPFWNSLVVAGYDKGQSFLGKVDLVGTCYTDDYIATGYGSQLALPLMRKFYDSRPQGLTQDEAIQLIKDCLRVLFYRDARSSRTIKISIINESGVKTSDPIELETYHWKSGESAINDPK